VPLAAVLTDEVAQAESPRLNTQAALSREKFDHVQTDADIEP